ncbi:MAG: 4Fe-4S dicluster domain-containing protein, partial [Planctomycetota bacterium]
MSDEKTPTVKEKVLASIKAIDSGPRFLKMYMDMCIKCGTCAEQCPVYFGSDKKKYNPSARSDLIRSIYKKHNTVAGKLLGGLVGARDFKEGELEEWVESFYSCTACRR